MTQKKSKSPLPQRDFKDDSSTIRCRIHTRVRVWSITRDGNRKLLVDDHNVTTDAGLQRMAELAGGKSEEALRYIAIGDGGTPESDLTVPIAPTPTAVALNHEITRQELQSHNIVVSQNLLRCAATFLTTPAEGHSYDFRNAAAPVINEAGILCSDGTLFGIVSWSSIPFAPADRVGLVVEWFIYFE